METYNPSGNANDYRIKRNLMKKHKITPKFKKEPQLKTISTKVGMYDGCGCSSRATRKNTWVCPNEKCTYTSRRFYGLEMGHDGLTVSLHKVVLQNSVCSLTCPHHNEELLFLGDIWRLPKKGKKREKVIRELKKSKNV